MTVRGGPDHYPRSRDRRFAAFDGAAWSAIATASSIIRSKASCCAGFSREIFWQIRTARSIGAVPVSVNRSASLQSSSCAICASRSSPGMTAPRSMFESVACVMSACSESFSCVMPSAFRRAAMALPIATTNSRRSPWSLTADAFLGMQGGKRSVRCRRPLQKPTMFIIFAIPYKCDIVRGLF